MELLTCCFLVCAPNWGKLVVTLSNTKPLFCNTDEETSMVLTSFSIPDDIVCCSSLLSIHKHLQADLKLEFDP